MSVLITEQSGYFFTSDTTAGALNVSADGSAFSVQLSDPLYLPPSVVGAEVGIISASVWNTSPNIGAGLGPAGVNNNGFRYTTSTGTPGVYDIVIPEGLYSLSALSSYLSTQFVNNGHAANLFSLGGQGATGIAYVSILTNGDTVNFEAADSVGVTLGFPAVAVVAPSANYNSYGTSVATLNRNNTYLVSTTLISGGIPTNSNARGIIGSVPITAAPGSLINFQAQNILWADAKELIGQRKTNFSFRLTNERLEATPTAGETWSIALAIRTRRLVNEPRR
jgi:hypothetical protein